MLPNLLRAVFHCKDFLQFITLVLIFTSIFFGRILFPHLGDQPVAAAHITENLQAGFELFQVRSGKGVMPIYRNGLTPAGSREAVGIEVRQLLIYAGAR